MINIFYAWQSDSNKKTNKNYIKKWLLKVIKDLNASKYSVNLIEGGKGVVGFHSIDKTIIDGINKSEIFIADITSITTMNKKALPNPNVVFEMGYFFGKKGETGVIAINNVVNGSVSDGPFDLNGRSQLTYSLGDSVDRYQQAQISKKFRADLHREIVDRLDYLANRVVKSARDTKTTNTPTKVSEKDIEVLIRLLNVIPLRFLTSIIDDGRRAQIIRSYAFNIELNIRSVIEYPTFIIENKPLNTYVQRFIRSFFKILSFGEKFFLDQDDIYRYSREHGDPNEYVKTIDEFDSVLLRFTKYLRKTLPSIDIDTIFENASLELNNEIEKEEWERKKY